MKKYIKFGAHVVNIYRSGSHHTASIISAYGSNRIGRLANIADELDSHDQIEVTGIYPMAGVVIFYVGNMTNTELLDAVCDAISHVYNTDVVVSDERI